MIISRTEGLKSNSIEHLLLDGTRLAAEVASKCDTSVLTPLTLKIHDTYIVNNLGAELKAKAPP